MDLRASRDPVHRGYHPHGCSLDLSSPGATSTLPGSASDHGLSSRLAHCHCACSSSPVRPVDLSPFPPSPSVVAAHRVSHCLVWGILSCLTKDRTCVPHIARQILNHGNIREVPCQLVKLIKSQLRTKIQFQSEDLKSLRGKSTSLNSSM